jgi:hypothetical protein
MSTYETLTSLQSGNPVFLQQPIDNRKGDLSVALRSLTYTIGWYNLMTAAWFSWTPVGKGTGVVNIDPGLYTAQGLIDLMLGTEAGKVYGLKMSVSAATGLFTVTAPGMEISASDAIWKLLGLDIGLGETWFGGTHTGDRPVDFSGVDRVYVHLSQLSTHQNSVDGAPSSLLDIIVPPSATFGTIVEVVRPLPLWKRLENGVVSELAVRLLDSSGAEIDSHGLQATAVFEFRQGSELYRNVDLRPPCCDCTRKH